MHELMIGGACYRLASFDEGLALDQVAWARKQLGDPLAECAAALKDFPEALHRTLLDDALAEKKRRATLADDSPEIQALLRSAAGYERLVLAIYQRHQPHLGEDQVWQLHAAARAQHGDDYLKRLMPAEKG